MEDRWFVPQINSGSEIFHWNPIAVHLVEDLSGLSVIDRLQRESWGFRKCTANWMNGICGQTPRGKRMETETRSWGFEHTFQEFGSIRVNILGIWIDSGTPAPKMKSRSKIHAKFAVFSLFFCVFHPQNPQNFRLRRPDPQKSLNPQDFFQNASKSPALRNTGLDDVISGDIKLFTSNLLGIDYAIKE